MASPSANAAWEVAPMLGQAPKDAATLDNILEELRRNKRKGWTEKLPPFVTMLSTLVLGLAGLWFTKSYNDHQAELAEWQARQDLESKHYQTSVLEMQAIERFLPYLTTDDERTKEAALLVIAVGSPRFAAQFAKLSPSPGTAAATDRIMARASTDSEKQTPGSVVPALGAKAAAPTIPTEQSARSGWVYLGHFVEQETRWQTRYFDFADSAKPTSLLSTVQAVRTETGSLNVRAAMPSISGEFQSVRDVLKPSSQVKIKSIHEWSSTGYMWAEIDYSK